MTTFEERQKIIAGLTALHAPVGKFSPKLDFEQRCEILALYRTGVSRSVLAQAYGLDRRTVTHIYNSKSPHYRMIRDEEERLGRQKFIERYITENAVNRMRNADIPAVDPERPKAIRNATRWRGVHTIKNDYMSKFHRIQIEWMEASIDNAGAGWYYRDADGSDPLEWYHNGDESRHTSKACLEAVKENLID